MGLEDGRGLEKKSTGAESVGKVSSRITPLLPCREVSAEAAKDLCPRLQIRNLGMKALGWECHMWKNLWPGLQFLDCRSLQRLLTGSESDVGRAVLPCEACQVKAYGQD